MRKRRTRRRFLAAVGTTGLLSGCLRFENDGTPTGTLPGEGGTTDSPTATPTDMATERPVEDEKATDTATPAPEPIQVAALLPMSGTLGDFGPPMLDAVELAVQDVNDAGGPLGRPIELHTEDTQSNPEVTREVFSSLVDELPDLAAVVGPAGSPSVIDLAPDLIAADVFGLSPSSTKPETAEAGYDGSTKYVGRTAPNDVQQSITMAHVMHSASFMNADTAAFLHSPSGWLPTLARMASERFDGETLQTVQYAPGGTDYSGSLDKVFTGSPDAVGLIGHAEDAETILKQWDEGGYGGNWVLSNTLNDPGMFGDLGSIADGMYLVFPSPEETAGTAEFESRTDSPAPFTHNSYDAAFLLALAIQRGEAADGTTISRNLRAVATGGGTQVTVGEFGAARERLAAGQEVDYQGARSPMAMKATLEPIHQYGIFEISGGEAQLAQELPRSFFEGKY